MFPQVASVVELVGLQIDACRANVGKRGFVQNVGGYVLDGGIDDFVAWSSAADDDRPSAQTLPRPR